MRSANTEAAKRLAEHLELIDGWNGHRNAETIRSIVAERDALLNALREAAEIARNAIPTIGHDGPSSLEDEAVCVEIGHVYTEILVLIDRTAEGKAS